MWCGWCVSETAGPWRVAVSMARSEEQSACGRAFWRPRPPATNTHFRPRTLHQPTARIGARLPRVAVPAPRCRGGGNEGAGRQRRDAELACCPRRRRRRQPAPCCRRLSRHAHTHTRLTTCSAVAAAATRAGLSPTRRSRRSHTSAVPPRVPPGGDGGAAGAWACGMPCRRGVEVWGGGCLSRGGRRAASFSPVFLLCHWFSLFTSLSSHVLLTRPPPQN